jgi:hypothetical protein
MVRLEHLRRALSARDSSVLVGDSLCTQPCKLTLPVHARIYGMPSERARGPGGAASADG